MRLAGLLCLAVLGVFGVAASQPYPTLAWQPDPRDFVGRSDAVLTLLGDPLRFMGYGLGQPGPRPDGQLAPVMTVYEVGDALATVQALGGTVVRSRPIDAEAGCSNCGKPTRTVPDPRALAALDLVLKTAHDMGLKVIVPLAGAGGDCAQAGDVACGYAKGRGFADATAFFADPGVRADFLAGVAQVLDHLNPLTGIAYRDDPTIMAWENCLACGAGADAHTVSAWSEQLGQAIKARDRHHLYENGAFAGRIGPAAANPVMASDYATASVDIVGDDLATGADTDIARGRLDATSGQVLASGRPYVLDSVGWAPSAWKNADDFDTWVVYLSGQRKLSGTVAGDVIGHAEGGGFLPASLARQAPHVAALYFPGIATPEMSAQDMQQRGRALRRLAYGIADILQPPAYLLAPEPQVFSAAHGHLLWRGSAGAATYSIERSPDPSVPGSWTMVCNACVTDVGHGWTDTAPPAEPAWYRVIPANINGHRSVPSEPILATR